MAYSSEEYFLDDDLDDLLTEYNLTEEKEEMLKDFEEECDKDTDDSDNDETCYCICKNTNSMDDLIGCDNVECAVQWYHLSCVGLSAESVPKDDWLCPNCSSRSGTKQVTKENISKPSCKENVPRKHTDVQQSKQSTNGSAPLGKKSDRSKKLKKGKVSSIKKVTIKQPASQTSVEEVKSKAVDFLHDVLQGIAGDELYHDTENSRDLMTLVETLMKIKSSTPMVEFVKLIISRVWDSICKGDGKKLGPEASEIILTNVFEISMDRNLRDNWRTILREQGGHDLRNSLVCNFVYVQLVNSIHSQLISMRQGEINRTVIEKDRGLTEEEIQIVRYVSGFIPFALVKHYRKHKNGISKIYREILQSWKAVEGEGDSFFEHSDKWVNMQDRGGLFHVNDTVFRLFMAMEIVSKKHLLKDDLKKFRNVNMQHTLMVEIVNDAKVQNCWCNVTKNLIAGELSINLLHIVSSYWAKIRCKHFLNACMNLIKKNDSQMSKKHDKGLRKNLASK
ncbi:uncharacterized protein LOC117112516 [Anneissia japonica]|uniref:uncharacterized protein LOC117112516 n=1 Tax=Anneissia japonica TaxID=1529436 RepID=UPI0014256505|nr:uncharacterized protein LOC117112516 [Anneissia japonica]